MFSFAQQQNTTSPRTWQNTTDFKPRIWISIHIFLIWLECLHFTSLLLITSTVFIKQLEWLEPEHEQFTFSFAFGHGHVTKYYYTNAIRFEKKCISIVSCEFFSYPSEILGLTIHSCVLFDCDAMRYNVTKSMHYIISGRAGTEINEFSFFTG